MTSHPQLDASFTIRKTSLTIRKVDYIFEEPFILRISFFFFRSGFQEKIEQIWRNCLIWAADWLGEDNTTDTQNTITIFWSGIFLMEVILWTEDNFCFTSDCRNLFNCQIKLENFSNNRANNYFL